MEDNINKSSNINKLGTKVIDENVLEYKIHMLEQSINKIDKRYIKTNLIVKDVVKYIRIEYVYNNNFDHLNNIHNLLSKFPMDIIGMCYDLKKYKDVIITEIIQTIVINNLSDINIIDIDFWTYGHYMCSFEEPDINVIKLLLDNGLDINASNNNNDTIISLLFMTSEIGSHILKILDLLIDYGMKFDKNHLDYVIENYPKKYNLIKYLLDKI